LTTYEHPNLIVIPVVDQISNGSKPYTVVGFAWFIIQKYTAKTVEGMFIGSQAPNGEKCPTATDPNAACPVGGYNTLGFKGIELARRGGELLVERPGRGRAPGRPTPQNPGPPDREGRGAILPSKCPPGPADKPTSRRERRVPDTGKRAMSYRLRNMLIAV